VSDRRLVAGSAERAARHPSLRYALVAGGGTAGHLEPALAVAEALVADGHSRDEIQFVGSRRGQDETALAGRGFPVTLLAGRGIVRRLRPRDLVSDVVAIVELVTAAFAACRLVQRLRPRVVVSVGGYASVAAATAAVLLRVPLVLVNIDAVPGAANRLFGRMARASAVGWPGTPLPRAVVTGTPVRPAISAVVRDAAARAAARRSLGLPEDIPVVGVFGGSLGARRINEAACDLVDEWRGRSDRAVYHVVGRRDWSASHDPTPPAGSPFVRRVPYEEHMELLYTAADVMVCRAGAMTVAELAVTGCPAVLVPLPGAPGDHQTANARVLERAGAGRILPDQDCDGATLRRLLDELLADGARLAAMGRAAAALGRRDAAAAGARVVEAHARPAPTGSNGEVPRGR
jgi:UDP-N-acetylglucosamine--N-acetylmuramyl-(pentapeptide) pyrophosphoryl-undecaprenol N-acetylglucosamine transferase